MERQDYLIPPAEYMFVVPPKTALSQFIEEARKLLLYCPEILNLIQNDLDEHARKKKRLRLADKQWNYREAGSLDGGPMQQAPIADKDLELKKGRPRMAPEVCYFFMAVRGYAGGVKGFDARTLFMESTSIQLVLAEAGVKMPGLSTIIENTNAISIDTRNAILDAQLRMFLEEGKDDFKCQIVDSTAVEAHTAWPTDSSLIFALIGRLWKRGNQLERFGLSKIENPEIPEILKDLKKLDFRISNLKGKKNSVEKRVDLYAEFIDLAELASQDLGVALKMIHREASKKRLKPSLEDKLSRLLEWLDEDMKELDRLIEACIRRVQEGEPPSSNSRMLSMSDPDAAYIQKGGREPVIGYRVQLARTGKGFVSNYIVPKGNANDASQFIPLCEGAINRTGVVPDLLSADGCYGSKEKRDELLAKGIRKVSISSSRGKAITPLEDWESAEYKAARSGRSAVESFVYQLKWLVNLGRMVRTGLENVRSEIAEKILAFNFLRACRV